MACPARESCTVALTRSRLDWTPAFLAMGAALVYVRRLTR